MSGGQTLFHYGLGHRRLGGVLIPTILVAGMAFCILPFCLFLVATAASAASFYAHVYLDKEYHVQAPKLARFAWFRRK
jgi:hypothetical protein